MFRFLGLPGEIRNKIYEHLLLPQRTHARRENPAYIDSALDSEPFSRFWMPPSSDPLRVGDPQCQNPFTERLRIQPSILRTNRQIYQEAIGIFRQTDWIFVRVNRRWFTEDLRLRGFPVLACPDAELARPFLRLTLDFASIRHDAATDSFVLPDYCSFQLYRIVMTIHGLRDSDLKIAMDLKNLRRTQVDFTCFYGMSQIRCVRAYGAFPENIRRNVPATIGIKPVNVAGRVYSVILPGGAGHNPAVVIESYDQAKYINDVIESLKTLLMIGDYCLKERRFKLASDYFDQGIVMLCDFDRDHESHSWARIRVNKGTLQFLAKGLTTGLVRAASKLGKFKIVEKYSMYLLVHLLSVGHEFAIAMFYNGQASLSLENRRGGVVEDFFSILYISTASTHVIEEAANVIYSLTDVRLRKLSRVFYHLHWRLERGLLLEPIEAKLKWWLEQFKLGVEAYHLGEEGYED